MKASKKDRGRILDQVVEVPRSSRDNARRRLDWCGMPGQSPCAKPGLLSRRYDCTAERLVPRLSAIC